MRYPVLFTLFLSLPCAAAPAPAHIGFFAPDGVPAAIVGKTAFAMVNARSPEQIADSLRLAEDGRLTVNIDFGPVLTDIKPAAGLATVYRDANDQPVPKRLPALGDNKIRVLPADAELERRLAPYLPALREHAARVGALFLVDEPYLNGVSRDELERAARAVRALLDRNSLPRVRLGVIFASAMFHLPFADMSERAAGRYVAAIDAYHADTSPKSAAQQAEFEAWQRHIATARLTTYDSAGNMTVSGGIPAGYDVVGYDFYLSTLLLDALHEDTLAWFAQRFPDVCGRFRGSGMKALRSRLTFFRDGPVAQRGQAFDRALLDAMYTCRMEASTRLLEREIAQVKGSKPQILLIGESSNNGLFEFDARGNLEPGQPNQLVEARVYDEV
ncbi:MAG TPA: hypothetical protein VIT92_13310, partial [Burkholderiaceae bacterium]